MPIIDEVLEQALAVVRESKDHRVLTRLVPPAFYSLIAPEDKRVGVFVDCETTGLDPAKDRIIEIGLARFTFAPDGRIGAIGPVYDSYVDPGIPIPAEITELTGITDATVKGQYPDAGLIEATLADAVLIVAHHAEFDREFFETQVSGAFADFPWGCSQRDVPWRSLGVGGQKLDYLLQNVAGCFAEHHGAMADCYAGIHVLAQAARVREEDEHATTYFGHLLDTVRRPTVRLSVNPPRGFNEQFKKRGYRAKYVDGKFQCWWRDVAPEQVVEEENFMVRDCGCSPHSVGVKTIRARDRFSSRV